MQQIELLCSPFFYMAKYVYKKVPDHICKGLTTASLNLAGFFNCINAK
jgi:hypothetical protein